MTTIIGTPGAHASLLARRRAAPLLAVPALALVALFMLPSNTLVALGCAAAAFVVGKVAWPPVARALAGANAEKRVARTLSRVKPAIVLHGADLGRGGDADHVVLGPVCAVVETKTGRGAVRRTQAGFFVGNRKLVRDPLAQATTQAGLLRRFTGCYVTAIACIVDMDGPPVQLPDGWVCSVKDLPRVLNQLPRSLDSRAASDIASSLTNDAAKRAAR